MVERDRFMGDFVGLSLSMRFMSVATFGDLGEQGCSSLGSQLFTCCVCLVPCSILMFAYIQGNCLAAA